MPSLAVLYNPDKGCWLRYDNPVEEVEVHQIDEVYPALQHIERRVEVEGLHAAGFISYEASAAFDEALTTHSGNDFPLLRFGLFHPPRPFDLPTAEQTTTQVNWQAQTSRKEFSEKVEAIRSAIARGETYQVNLTFPLTGETSLDPWQFFLNMIHGQRPDNCGFLLSDSWAICSASPELFVHRHGHHLTMRPMKGTAARGRTLAEDKAQALELQQSVKNRAENIMILDMVRNDLGRLAPPGAVKTEAICTLEKYPTVWQLTSTATAISEASMAEVFKALFPCASITGAPKAKTMEIIKETENTPRGIYTGAFGSMAPGRKAHFNVAIRTAAFDRRNKAAIYGIGAGITWDSDGTEEYRECLDKAALLNRVSGDFALIETLRWTPGKGFFILREHLERLQSSAEYFDFQFDRESTESFLSAVAVQLPASPQRVRLLLCRDGRLESRHSTIDSATKKVAKICFAREAVNSANIFLFHKTTQRKLYEQNLSEAENADEVILWNEHGEVTEGCTTNLVIDKQGRLVTPALSCGLLPGTYREYLIKKGVIIEEMLTKDDLRNSARIFLINAVRKWRRAEFAD